MDKSPTRRAKRCRGSTSRQGKQIVCFVEVRGGTGFGFKQQFSRTFFFEFSFSFTKDPKPVPSLNVAFSLLTCVCFVLVK